MKFSTLLRFSWHNIKAQKLRTFLTLSSVVVGGFLIFLLPSLGLGVTKSINQELSKDQLTDLSVSPKYKQQSFDFNETMPSGVEYERRLEISDIETIKNIEGVKAVKRVGLSLSPESIKIEKTGQELAIGGNEAGEDGSIPYMDIIVIPTGLNEKEYNLSLVTGRFLTTEDTNNPAVVVSKSLIEGLKFDKQEELIGSKITLQFEQDQATSTDPSVFLDNKSETKSYTFTVVGITEPTNNSGFSPSGVELYMPLQPAWSIKEWQQANISDFATTYSLSSLEVVAQSTNDVEPVTQKIKALNLETFSSLDMVKFVRRAAAVVVVFLASFGLIALFVGGLNILNTMMMAVTERTKEIGIMRSLGASRKAVRTLFLLESAMIAFIGAVVGMFFGWVVSLIANFGFHLWLGNVMKDSVDKIPSNVFDYSWPLIFGVLAFVTLVGMISGIIPALRASRLNVVESLRYE